MYTLSDLSGISPEFLSDKPAMTAAIQNHLDKSGQKVASGSVHLQTKRTKFRVRLIVSRMMVAGVVEEVKWIPDHGQTPDKTAFIEALKSHGVQVRTGWYNYGGKNYRFDELVAIPKFAELFADYLQKG